jgi:hypothetical protein
MSVWGLRYIAVSLAAESKHVGLLYTIFVRTERRGQGAARALLSLPFLFLCKDGIFLKQNFGFKPRFNLHHPVFGIDKTGLLTSRSRGQSSKSSWILRPPRTAIEA